MHQWGGWFRVRKTRWPVRRLWCPLSLVETIILNLPVSCHLQRGLLCKNCFIPPHPKIIPATNTHYILGQYTQCQFSSVAQPCLTLYDPITTACQASLFITNSQSLLKLMSIESVMPSNHLDLCVPFSSHLQSFPASGSFPISQFFQNIGVSASVSVLPMTIRIDFL